MKVLLRLQVLLPLLLTIYTCTCDRIADEVKQLSKEFFDFRIKMAPEYATKFSINGEAGLRYNVSDVGEQADSHMIQSSEDFLRKTVTLEKEKLNSKDRETISILKDILQTYIEGSKFKDYGQFSTIRTYFTEVLRVIRWMPKESHRDASDMIHRIKLQSENFYKVILRLKNSVAKNITDYHQAVATNIEDLNSEIFKITINISDSLFYKEFMKFKPEILHNNKAYILEVIQNNLKTAMRNMSDYLVTEYLPLARRIPGIWYLPNGDEYYKACLKWHLSINIDEITPQDIHEIGLKEVKLIEEDMRNIIKNEQPDGNLKEFKRKIYAERTNFYKNEEELKKDIESKLKSVHSKLGRVFTTVSNERLEFEINQDPNGPSAFYTDPPLNGSRPGVFSLNKRAVADPKFNFPTLCLHEAEPGHHSQSVTVKLTDAPIFRKLIEYRHYPLVPYNWPFFTAVTEGWALYAESLGDELDAYDDKYAKFGYLASNVFRASRIVVDTGIHYKRWSKQKAAQYLEEHTFLSADNIDNELDRYITIPGQACAYKIGQLHIVKELNLARKAIGKAFDKRKYHDMILKLGSVSLKQITIATKHFIDNNSPSAASSLSYSIVMFIFVFFRFVF